MSHGTRRPNNNGAEQLNLFGEEELAKLQLLPVTSPPTDGETSLSLEADGVCKVTSQEVRERAANRGVPTQLRLPEV
jgi:hypothetical protein